MSTATKRADSWASTIIAFESPYRMREMLPPEAGAPAQGVSREQRFKIRLATSDERRRSASMVISKMYLSRGYGVPDLSDDPYRITIVVSQEDRLVGTTTLGLDSPEGLLVDESYRAEVDQLRARNRTVCELTKLAIDDENVDSKHIVAVLFHLCKIYGHNIHNATDFLIEVNPRHALFYRRMLGFVPLGPQRTCARVNAPSVLLHLPVEHAEEQIVRHGGTAKARSSGKSLYPFCFSKNDEVGIAGRLLRGD
jgi:hypothetical protein